MNIIFRLLSVIFIGIIINTLGYVAIRYFNLDHSNATFINATDVIRFTGYLFAVAYYSIVLKDF